MFRLNGIVLDAKGTVGNFLATLIVAVFSFSPLLSLAQPNIIIILTDDMALADLPYMPTVQAELVSKGMEFQNAFVSHSTCCPSRASIMTGMYPHNHGVVRNGDGFAVFSSNGDESKTTAKTLQDNGYRTVLIGKYFNDYGLVNNTYIPQGWNEWYSALPNLGYYDYNLNVNGVVVKYGSTESDYQTDVHAGMAVDAINRLQTDTRPLFMYLSLKAPHEPATAAARHNTAYSMLTAPRKANFNETDVSDKPVWIRELATISGKGISTIDDDYRKRLRTLLGADEAVGSVLNALAAQGQLENTYILFMSDHGWHQGEHRLRSGKGTAYEESLRIPFVIRGPDVLQGAKNSNFVITNDIMPTLLEVAGVRIPTYIDGRSIMALMTGAGSGANWRQQFLVEAAFSPVNEISAVEPPHYYAVRTTKYTYVYYIDTGETELYDNVADPSQVSSLHASQPGLVVSLSSMMDQLRFCAGPTCKDAENMRIK